MEACLEKNMTTETKQLKCSVLIPTYNMAGTIEDTARSALNQTYQNFEIIVQDNDSQDNTRAIIESLADPRIKYFKNATNLGYAKNLIAGAENCHGDILYFLGADDILSKNALLETVEAFAQDDNIGAVTRPYFWFQTNIETPIRVTPALNAQQDEIIYIENYKKAIHVLHNEILGQLSGLAFRLKYLEKEFFTTGNDWIAHGYPFINIFKKHPVVFLKNYPVAIRIGGNVVRQVNNEIYKISPTKRWLEMLDEILPEEKFKNLKNYFIKNIITTNYLGLIQIKCYSKFKFLLREILYLLKYNWLNVLHLKFWFFSLGCICVPRSLLAKMVDYYKNKINSKIIKKNNFTFDIK